MSRETINLDGDPAMVFTGMSFAHVDRRRFRFHPGKLVYRNRPGTVELSFRYSYRIREIQVHWNASYAPAQAEFFGSVVFQRREHRFSRRTLSGHIRKVFGEPYFEAIDEDESIFFYEFGNQEIQFEFSPFGQLRSLVWTATPLMRDGRQRRLYGVDDIAP